MKCSLICQNNTFYLTYFPDHSVTLPVGMLVTCIPIPVISKMLIISFLYTHYNSVVLWYDTEWTDQMWPLCVIPSCTDDPLNLLVSNWWTEGKFHFIFAKIKELHNNRTEFCLISGCLGVIPSAETRNVLSILFLLNVALSLHILTVFQIPPTTIKQIKFRFTHGIGIHVRIILHD